MRAVLAAFADAPNVWRYGLELANQTGLQSGTLYPLLMRLADDRYLESKWMEPSVPGRPPRHAYRLTATGVAFAHAQLVKASLRLNAKRT